VPPEVAAFAPLLRDAQLLDAPARP
jgi:hypothetical protein